MELPEIGSRWVNIETAVLFTVHEGPDDEVRRLDCSACGQPSMHIQDADLEAFYRENILDSTVSLDSLASIGWRVSHERGFGAAYRDNETDHLYWGEDGLSFETWDSRGENVSVTIPVVRSLRDVLLAMHLFGVRRVDSALTTATT
jgi:hypothetical protein